MRRIIFVLAALLLVSSLAAENVPSVKPEDNKLPFSIKAYVLRGHNLEENGTHFAKFNGAYPTGVTLGFELPSTQIRPWQQYLGNPTVGLGLTCMNLGHSMLGHAIAAYPYILLDAIDTRAFQMRFKVAGGLACVTEHWYTQKDQNPDHYYDETVNTVFGCYLNVYLNAGVNLNFPITDYLAVGGEFGYFHMSNGRTCMPNIGMNCVYGSVGVTATLNSEAKNKRTVQFPDQPYGWALNITGAAGAQKAAIEDSHRFLISSLHVGAVYHVNNWYGVGIGTDVFYNSAVTKFTARSQYCDGTIGDDSCLTCGDQIGVDYSFAQKVRAGLALNNEFKFGAVTAMVDWGVYFYNPSRHIYDSYHEDYHLLGQAAPKRELLYKSPHGAGSEEAFHYIRFGLKYRIWDNLYLHTSAKTHMHICEYVEFGVGYQIPFFKRANRVEGQSKIFHYKKEWWKDM